VLVRASAWAAPSYAMSHIQLATVHILDRDTRYINVDEASHIYAPLVGGGSRPSKWQDAAHGAEVVFCDLCVPFIDR